jgi:hypothetical protein
MAKQSLPINEIIESHKPKNFKYRFIITDESVYDELQSLQYDLSNLDTINDDELIQEALKADYTWYERDVVKRAKEPTIFENGVILSKKMVTKTDKKLIKIGTGFFEFRNLRYVSIRMVYERFDIIEIFIMT